MHTLATEIPPAVNAVIVAVILVGLLVMTVMLARNKEAARKKWQTFADAHGLALRDGRDGLRTWMTAEGTLDGCAFRLHTEYKSQSTVGPQRPAEGGTTSAALRFPKPLGMSLLVASAKMRRLAAVAPGMVDQALSVFGGDEVGIRFEGTSEAATGDAGFDAAVYVRAKDPAEPARRLDGRARAALRALLDGCGERCVVTDEGVFYATRDAWDDPGRVVPSMREVAAALAAGG